MTTPKLSVVIPAFNEASNLKLGLLDNIEGYLKKQSYVYEVLIVDDGSTDQTVQIITQQIKNKKNFTLIKNPHGGKAVTVMTGLLKSSGGIALFTDMDQATPLCEIEKFFPKFEQGFDVVIGSREGRKGAPLVRKLMAWGFSLVRGLVLGLPISDTQCGFKAFNRKTISKVFPELLAKWQNTKTSGAAVNAGFDVETLFLTRKKGFKISEVKVDWRHVGTERVQAIGDSVEALRDVLKIRVNDWRGRYD